MKSKDIRELTDEELKQRTDDRYEELFKLRMQQGAGQIENPLLIRELRREIARIKTILHERERNAG
jgi:large subunit ribosomal protein L29